MRGARVIETSPRLGGEYREYMQRWFSYRTSDFDLSAHRGDIQIDLQQIDLPDAAVDVVLTPHVLEHVPDTGKALSELFRVIAPGGRMYLQVPLVYGATSVADRARVPRRQHAGVLQLRLGPDRSAPRRRVHDDRAGDATSTTRSSAANSTRPIRTATASTSTSCSSTSGWTTSPWSPTTHSRA